MFMNTLQLNIGERECLKVACQISVRFCISSLSPLNTDFEGTPTVPNNTYKAVRLLAADYNLFYSVWCNNEHELYDLNVSLP